MSPQSVISVPINEIKNNWKREAKPVSSHSMQILCSRVCSFPISIPEYFITNFTKKNDVVFDAWSGKGTVPFEALRHNRIGIGNDKSPEAFILTHAKVKPIQVESLKEFVSSLKRRMNRIKVTDDATELDRKAAIFYSKKTFEQILKLKKILLDDNSREAIFIKAITLGLLHGSNKHSLSLTCSHSYSMSPTYVKKYVKEHHLRRPSKDVLQCILERGEIILGDTLPTRDGLAFQNDSTDLELNSKSVNMILTSPPYFGVQTYAWANWLRLWFLGHDYKKVRSMLGESDSTTKYREFMSKSISELYRVLKPGGRCFIVVGDVKAGRKNIPINTAEFLLPSCLDAGFTIEKIVKDNIPYSRKVMTYVSESEGIKTERIMYLVKPHR